jgi:hypothetical protein
MSKQIYGGRGFAYDVDHGIFSLNNGVTSANITVIFLKTVITKGVKKFPAFLETGS